MSLADLVKKGSLRGFATATPATTATDTSSTPSSVASVATVAVAKPPDTATNDATPDPDRWCWPHSSAMNGAEIETFTQRSRQFIWCGLAELEAETVAGKLMFRDREQDDRRLCLECLHLKSGGDRWCCNQWQRAGLGAAGLSADLVRQLQRCDSFTEVTP